MAADGDFMDPYFCLVIDSVRRWRPISGRLFAVGSILFSCPRFMTRQCFITRMDISSGEANHRIEAHNVVYNAALHYHTRSI